MEAHLDELQMAVYHGYHRMPDAMIQVSWDTDRHPDFRQFVEAARRAGAKLIIFHQQPFAMDQIDGALDQLDECDFTREEKRSYEARLRKLQAYEGFTCSLELSFVHEGRVFIFEQHTDWYESFAEIVSEIEAASEEEDEDGEDGSLGSYFSNN